MKKNCGSGTATQGGRRRRSDRWKERNKGSTKDEGGERLQALFASNVKERCTYVVKPALDRFVRHRRSVAHFLSSTITYLFPPSILSRSSVMNRDYSSCRVDAPRFSLWTIIKITLEKSWFRLILGLCLYCNTSNCVSNYYVIFVCFETFF